MKNHKKFVFIIMLVCITVAQVFAADDAIGVLDEWGDKVLALLSSNWVKVLLLVALIVEAIMMVVAGQQGGGNIMKRFGPWIIGTIILLSANGIVSYFVKDMKFEVVYLLQSASQSLALV